MSRHSLFSRTKTDLIVRALQADEAHPNVLLIEGPRQSGKTTTVLQAIERTGREAVHLNLERDLRYRAQIDRCEDFRDFEQWLADTFNFKPGTKTILFIDEAQESQRLGRFVRSMKEEWEHTHVLLTGSMMSRLFRDDVRYPVGRVTVIHIQTLSFFEYLAAMGKDEWLAHLNAGDLSVISNSRHEALLRAFNDYLHIGGFPAVIRAALDEKNHRDMRLEIYEAYRNDFMRVFGEDQGFLFDHAMRAVANHVGTPSKFSQAIAVNDVAYKKIAETFSRLEAWHLVYTSEQRGPSPEGAQNLHPKRYLFDLGILSDLRTLGIPDLSVMETLDAAARTPLGGIFENAVAFSLTHLHLSLAGWKKNATGSEVDFVAALSKGQCPIECKATLKLKKNHLTGLKTYMGTYGLPIGVMVNAAPFEVYTDSLGTIFSVPIYAVEALEKIVGTS